MPNSKHVTTRAFLVILLLFASSLSAFSLRRERLIDKWKPSHYDLSLTLNDQLTEITIAQALIDIVAVGNLSVVDLDFGEMTTDAVTVGGQTARFIHHDGKLFVTLPQPITAGATTKIAITYHGKPKDGLALTNDKDGKPTAIGDNWPDRVHHWIPCLDHPSAKATVTFKISAPAHDLVVANGKFVTLETIDEKNKRWTYEETVPIPPYCMIIGVGEFAKFDVVGPTPSPLSLYVPYSDGAYANKGFSSAGPVLNMFSELVAPYPYEKLALIIGATRFGGMENSSAIVFASTLFNPNSAQEMSKAFGIRNGLESVVAHEIAHQWFGDSVTESTWADLWLSEGFATYFAGLFLEKYEGKNEFQSFMKKAASSVFTFEEKSHTPIHDRETEDLFKLLNENSYQKGAWVLHMLRSKLGDEAFFRGLKSYYSEHKNATANTEDLRRALEKTSSQNLQQFFARWVYDSGHPKYEVVWTWKNKKLRVAVNQKQDGNAFMDPLPVTITTATRTYQMMLRPKGKTVIETMTTTEMPKNLAVDPNQTILKEVLAIKQSS